MVRGRDIPVRGSADHSWGFVQLRSLCSEVQDVCCRDSE